MATDLFNSEEKPFGDSVGSQRTVGRTSYLTIEEGKNYFVVLPSITGGAPTLPKVVNWLTVTKDIYVDGEKTEEIVVKRHPVFNASFHGVEGQTDLVEAFMSYLRLDAIPAFTDDKNLQKTVKDEIYNAKKEGINTSRKMLCYAVKIEGDKETLGQLEFSYTQFEAVKKALKSHQEKVRSSENFLVKEDGSLVLEINKYKGAGDKWAYDVSFETEYDQASDTERKKKRALTDSDREFLNEAGSLEDRLLGIYSSKHFEWQQEGIRRFSSYLNSEYGINPYNDPRWQQTMERVKSEVEFPGDARYSNSDEEKKQEDILPFAKPSGEPLVKVEGAGTETEPSQDDIDAQLAKIMG